jgi:hypothetical protein
VVRVSPSASLAVKRLDAAKLSPWVAARLDAFTTGRVFAMLCSWKSRGTGGHRHEAISAALGERPTQN